MGPNGCGKSTLLRCLLGDISDFTGDIRKPTVFASVLDQARSGLNDAKTLYENAGGGSGYVGWGKHFMLTHFTTIFVWSRYVRSARWL